MKVRVKAEFRDRHTEKVYKIGDELEMNIQRINEVIAAGNFIELVEQPEQEKIEQPEKTEQEQADVQEEKADAGEQVTEEPPKQTARRKRTK